MSLDLSRLKVVLIDEDPSFRNLARQILDGFGITNVESAGSPEGGLAKIKASQPDVVITEHQFTERSGVELAKQIRLSSDSPNRYLPIIMLTGRTEKQVICDARDAGITEFIAKPMSVRGLYSRLISIVEQPREYVRTSEYFGPCRRRTADESYTGPERRPTPDNPAESHDIA